MQNRLLVQQVINEKDIYMIIFIFILFVLNSCTESTKKNIQITNDNIFREGCVCDKAYIKYGDKEFNTLDSVSFNIYYSLELHSVKNSELKKLEKLKSQKMSHIAISCADSLYEVSFSNFDSVSFLVFNCINYLDFSDEIRNLNNLNTVIIRNSLLSTDIGEVLKLPVKELIIEDTDFSYQENSENEIDSNLSIRSLTIENSLNQQIPLAFFKLERLEKLYIRNNNIVVLPGNLYELNSLRMLDISGNPIISLHKDISKLSKLETLIIDSTIMRNIGLSDIKLRLPNTTVLVR